MPSRSSVLLFAVIGTLLMAPAAQAICVGEAVVTADPSTDPLAPGWVYTVTITWSYLYGVHHWVIPLDSPDGTCSCSDFQIALDVPSPAGQSVGVPGGCLIPYAGSLECDGDPAGILTGKLLTFTPEESGDCGLDSAGEAVLQFRSALPPAAIAPEASFAAVSATGGACGMPLAGVFPAMACDPVDDEDTAWGALKCLYR
ncbi:hypothetical protein KJ682_18045 [bacterium]|nr:hypothetical protein [bacterium]